MATNYLITGYHGTPHVTAENDRGINAGIFGEGRYVLPVGNRFRAEYIGNNTIRVYDGKLVDNGAAAGIPVGEYVDLAITNASQSMKRSDLIVFQYRRNTSTQVETGSFVVVSGTETNGTPQDPTLTQANLLTGSVTIDQMPLWRVTVSGATIAAPVKVYTLAKTGTSMSAEDIGAAKEDHTHALNSTTVTGTLPVTKGGTGATDAETARLMLGVTPENIGASAEGHTHALTDNTVTGVLPVTKGGTGAANAPAALAALGLVTEKKALADIITLESTFDYSAENVDKCGSYISKFGNVVTMTFVLTPKSTITGGTDEVLMFTLPSAYRPPTMMTAVCQGSTRAVWTCRVYADGTVTFARYRLNDEYASAAAGTWLPCTMTWIVD